MSHGALASALSVSVGTIQNYERGRAVMTIDRIEKLAHALQCELLDLLMPPESPPPRYRHRLASFARLRSDGSKNCCWVSATTR
jgi:transcriptional regulator with XRE-family HTH domain